MDFAAPRSASLRVRRQHRGDPPFVAPDYFLIVDADEIYEAGTLERLAAYVRVIASPSTGSRAFGISSVGTTESTGTSGRSRWYAPTNACRISGCGSPTSFDVGFRACRGCRSPAVSDSSDIVDIPPSVGVFHHGSYVGPRARIEAKLQTFGHAHEVEPDWIRAPGTRGRLTPGTSIPPIRTSFLALGASISMHSQTRSRRTPGPPSTSSHDDGSATRRQ